jgi:mRNA-degrading endonuclease RelE of RelBE toxin-antitoxin system
MSYKLFILRMAHRELSSIPEDIYEKIKQEIFKLSQNPQPTGKIFLYV